MKVFICSSKYFYNKIDLIKMELENSGHEVILPNSYDNPFMEDEKRRMGVDEHKVWKSEMIKRQDEKVKKSDALLVLNFEKNGHKNYIGGATFLEIYEAFKQNKPVFLYNNIPDGIFKDELLAINPVVINGNLSKIK